jgi:hexosaminidase
MHTLIPRPVSYTPSKGAFAFGPATQIIVPDGKPEVAAVAEIFARTLRTITGMPLGARETKTGSLPGNIRLYIVADQALGEEGYELTVAAEAVRLVANTAAGLFYGTQTIRQLLTGRQFLPACTIHDVPRYPWRGMMLDVARHFFGVDEVKRLIDLIALYKMNRLHLHLSDDQGWRIEIKSWPELARIGGSNASRGDPGGYYTQDDYRKIVAYAQERHVMIVPEIDMPGHTHAALASYAELNQDGLAPKPYTGMKVGFSTFEIGNEITYRLVDDVVRELADLTPGPYIHVGGDEAHSTKLNDYVHFIGRVQSIVESHGKQMIGWNEVLKGELTRNSISQYWNKREPGIPRQPGVKVILSPAEFTYVDMKYDAGTKLGQDWAALINVERAYRWEPEEILPGLPSNDILGIEAALWTETIRTRDELDYMTFPRLPGLAEVAWSPKGGDWPEYRQRLARHAPLLQGLGVNFYRSPEIDWE